MRSDIIEIGRAHCGCFAVLAIASTMQRHVSTGIDGYQDELALLGLAFFAQAWLW